MHEELGLKLDKKLLFRSKNGSSDKTISHTSLILKYSSGKRLKKRELDLDSRFLNREMDMCFLKY